MNFFANLWCYIVCAFLSLAIAIAVAFFSVTPSMCLALAYLILGIIAYLYLLHVLAEKVMPAKALNALLLVGAFVMATAILVSFFAFGWGWFFAFGPPGGQRIFSAVDSLYFSSTVLFTVGFGDFVPQNTQSKYYFMLQALVGSVHFVSFFALGSAKVIASHRSSNT